MNTLRILIFAACFKPMEKRYPSLFGRKAAQLIIDLIDSSTAIEPMMEENA